MTKNIGNVERIVRGAAGAGLIAWGLMAHSWWGALGGIFLVTALSGWCPPYSLLGISTCIVKDA